MSIEVENWGSGLLKIQKSFSWLVAKLQLQYYCRRRATHERITADHFQGTLVWQQQTDHDDITVEWKGERKRPGYTAAVSFWQSKLQHVQSRASFSNSHLAISSFLIFLSSKFPLFSILLAASYLHYLIFSYLFFFSYISIHTHTQTHTYTHTYTSHTHILIQWIIFIHKSRSKSAFSSSVLPSSPLLHP